MEMRSSRKNQKGQAVTEYLLLVSIVTGFYLIIVNGLAKYDLDRRIFDPITGDFKRAYRFGHTKAKWYDDGGPENHALVREGKGNFRVFFNPFVRR